MGVVTQKSVSVVPAVGHLYTDTDSRNGTSKRKIRVDQVFTGLNEALVTITHDKNGQRLASPIQKYVKLDRFNGRSRGYKLLKKKSS